MRSTLNTLEIKILLKCNAGFISKSGVTQLFKAYAKKERSQAIDNLIANKLILTQEMPKAGSNKTPIFYKLTIPGKKWIDDYNKNYPKSI